MPKCYTQHSIVLPKYHPGEEREETPAKLLSSWERKEKNWQSGQPQLCQRHCRWKELVEHFIVNYRRTPSLYSSGISNATVTYKKNSGFEVDATKDKWEITGLILSSLTSKSYFNWVSQMTYHDLCPPIIISKSPLELGCLIGLSLPFCIQEERPKESVLKNI